LPPSMEENLKFQAPSKEEEEIAVIFVGRLNWVAMRGGEDSAR